jgi:hypothetical protein
MTATNVGVDDRPPEAPGPAAEAWRMFRRNGAAWSGSRS